MLSKGTSGTIFITSLVWCSPWLGIEPGTSRTRSHHSTTRLSRFLIHVSVLFYLLSIFFSFFVLLFFYNCFSLFPSIILKTPINSPDFTTFISVLIQRLAMCLNCAKLLSSRSFAFKHWFVFWHILFISFTVSKEWCITSFCWTGERSWLKIKKTIRS